MVKGSEEILTAVRNLKSQSIKQQNTALEEAAKTVLINEERITPVDTRRLLGDAIVGKPRSIKGIRQISIGYGKPVGWRAHFVDTGTIKQPAQNITLRTIYSSTDEVESIFIKHMKVK